MPNKELPAPPDGVEDVTVPELVRQALASGRGREEMEIAERMLQLQMRWEDNERKKAYAAAKTRLHFPPIAKTRKGAGSHYAPYEEVQAIIEPIYKAEGFDLSFDSSPQPDDKNGITVHGTLLHEQGHSDTRHIWQPIGAVSKMMNPNQGIVSATSYGKRALAGLIFNLRFVDADDDARIFSTINQSEISEIQKLIEEAKMDAESVSLFFDWASKQQGAPVKTISDIFKGEPYERVRDMLERKKKKVLKP